MRILVTNDDGVDSKGIMALAEQLGRLGEVCVVAPQSAQNAMGHALTLHKPLRVKEISHMVYSVSGTPTDCVVIGANEIFSAPDLVVSGINMGANLADDVTYSGTVAAAMEGTLMGIPSIAVSQFGDPPYFFDTAAVFAANLAKLVLESGLPKDLLLNVNLPNIEKKALEGVRLTRLGKRRYTKNLVLRQKDPRGREYFWVGGDDIVWEDIKDCDYFAVMDNMASVTPINMDMTDYYYLDEAPVKVDTDILFKILLTGDITHSNIAKNFHQQPIGTDPKERG